MNSVSQPTLLRIGIVLALCMVVLNGCVVLDSSISGELWHRVDRGEPLAILVVVGLTIVLLGSVMLLFMAG